MTHESMEFAREVLGVLKNRGIMGVSLQIERGFFSQEPTYEEFILIVRDAIKAVEDFEDRRRAYFSAMMR